MRPDYMGCMFLLSGVLSFNAGVWQIYRRTQKKQLLENHANLNKPPMKELPPTGGSMNNYEFHPIELEGKLDNTGSLLVGPRPLPSYKGAATTDESRGGFLVMTPFEIASNKEQIMVNRGWVPIDAGKHPVMLAQYIGQGIADLTLHGIIRKEEFITESFFSGKRRENEGPLAADLSWMVIRPWEMALYYYRKKWGESRVQQALEEHGAHHYFVEMIEDFSGDDQRLVRDHAWPRRRTRDELTYVHITPIIHSMYIVFWFSVCIGSLYGASKCFNRQKEIWTARKVLTRQISRVAELRQHESERYLQAMRDVEKRKLGQSTASSSMGIATSVSRDNSGTNTTTNVVNNNNNNNNRVDSKQEVSHEQQYKYESAKSYNSANNTTHDNVISDKETTR